MPRCRSRYSSRRPRGRLARREAARPGPPPPQTAAPQHGGATWSNTRQKLVASRGRSTARRAAGRDAAGGSPAEPEPAPCCSPARCSRSTGGRGKCRWRPLPPTSPVARNCVDSAPTPPPSCAITRGPCGPGLLEGTDANPTSTRSRGRAAGRVPRDAYSRGARDHRQHQGDSGERPRLLGRERCVRRRLGLGPRSVARGRARPRPALRPEGRRARTRDRGERREQRSARSFGRLSGRRVVPRRLDRRRRRKRVRTFLRRPRSTAGPGVRGERGGSAARRERRRVHAARWRVPHRVAERGAPEQLPRAPLHHRGPRVERARRRRRRTVGGRERPAALQCRRRRAGRVARRHGQRRARAAARRHAEPGRRRLHHRHRAQPGSRAAGPRHGAGRLAVRAMARRSARGPAARSPLQRRGGAAGGHIRPVRSVLPLPGRRDPTRRDHQREPDPGDARANRAVPVRPGLRVRGIAGADRCAPRVRQRSREARAAPVDRRQGRRRDGGARAVGGRRAAPRSPVQRGTRHLQSHATHRLLRRRCCVLRAQRPERRAARSL